MKIPPETFRLISGLPGEEIVAPGLRDIERGRLGTSEALLVLMARTRLAQAGLTFLDDVAVAAEPAKSAESLLYESLCENDAASAYGFYNSLKRRLDRFMRSLEARLDRADSV